MPDRAAGFAIRGGLVADGTGSAPRRADVVVRGDRIAVLGHPASVVASDGQALDPEGATGRGAPHPRSYGCFPRFLSDYQERTGLTLGEAIRKVTSAPAERVGLRDRGLVRAGLVADLVVLDMEHLADVATYADPGRHPLGVGTVTVGGQAVIDRGRQTSATPGTVVRRSGA